MWTGYLYVSVNQDHLAFCILQTANNNKYIIQDVIKLYGFSVGKLFMLLDCNHLFAKVG